MGFWMKCVFVLAVAVFASHFFNKFDEESIKGKKVFITGASQNIGQELAYQYAKLGAEIVITARRESELKRVVRDCIDFGAKSASYIVADMSEAGVYESVVADAVEKLGGLDIFILNHVLGLNKKWEGTEQDAEYVEKSTQLNYVSYVQLANAALPHLNRTKGQLIVISSGSGLFGVPNMAAYGATKAAIISFFSSLQNEALMHKDNSASISICILGYISTKNARWSEAKERIILPGHPVESTAREIIEGGSRKQHFVYIPSFLRLLHVVKVVFPELSDRILVNFMFRRQE